MTEPTGGDITVRHCVVRVVRRGGWSWGPDPRSLVQRALDAIPDLLADRFDDLLAGDGPDVEITEPVVLSVRLGRSRTHRPGAAPGVVVEAAPHLPGLVPVTRVPGTPPTEPLRPSTVDDSVERGPEAPVAGPAALFAELAERGELAAALALLPTPSLGRYLRAVLDSGSAEPLTAGVLDAVAAELTRRLSLPPVPGPATRDAVAGLVASLPTTAPERSAPAEPGTPRVEVSSAPRAVGEVRVGSVLPFLLAGPLARTGYLDAIGPALSGVGLAAGAPSFAAALAYQVLGRPERGWRRTPQDDAAAAAFAGLESAPDLAQFAGQVAPALPMLDAVLALSVCRGHDAADPLLVTGVAGGLLLVDANGMFPVAWAPRVAGLLPHWTAAGRPPVLVCDSPLPPATLRELAAGGVRLITDVRPVRDDPLTRLPWRTPLWTNGPASLRLAAALPAYADRLNLLVDSLFVARFAVRGTALDRSTTLAAALALGMIAWTLWRERETPDPLLALSRFAGLEATVRFTPRAVRVRLSLGQRHTDLWRSGLLTDVPNVVWLAGRTLTFSGG